MSRFRRWLLMQQGTWSKLYRGVDHGRPLRVARPRCFLLAIVLLPGVLSACQPVNEARGSFDPVSLAIGTLFVGAGLFTARRKPGGFRAAAKTSLPHLLGLWLPLIGALLLLYVFVVIGLMEKSAIDAASSENPVLVNPRWLVIILWLVGLGELLQLGRRLAGLYMADRAIPSFKQVKSLALLAGGLGAIYVSFNNPVSSLLMIPALLWLFIGGRSGAGRILDWLLLLASGLMIYLVAYFSGSPLLRIDLAALWVLMTMFSVQMISFLSGAIVMIIIAAGLSLLVRPPIGRRRTEAKHAQEQPSDTTGLGGVLYPPKAGDHKGRPYQHSP